MFNNFDEEEAIKTVSLVSKDINKLLRNHRFTKKTYIIISTYDFIRTHKLKFCNTIMELYKEDILLIFIVVV